MKKRILISVSAVLIIALLLFFAQLLVIPKYRDNPEGALVGEYYANAGGHDVIFIGDCEVYESFIPAVLFERHGITSYIRGSAQQLAWHSYYLLEETFKYETPKAVVFNVLALKYGEPQNEAYNRMTLDGMKWSGTKLKAISASMTEEESYLDYIFPLLRFHSRITSLNSDDFKYILGTPEVSFEGYLLQTNVVPQTDFSSGRIRADYTLPENSMEYLEKMRLLCEEHETELILIKAPTNTWGFWWYDEWDEQVASYAEENGLSYYNFLEKTEIGIDLSTDTYDAGMHLNVYGAEKLTDYFGAMLVTLHGITDRRGDAEIKTVWDKKITDFYTAKRLSEEKNKKDEDLK